jgi:hypothetical protein
VQVKRGLQQGHVRAQPARYDASAAQSVQHSPPPPPPPNPQQPRHAQSGLQQSPDAGAEIVLPLGLE